METSASAAFSRRIFSHCVPLTNLEQNGIKINRREFFIAPESPRLERTLKKSSSEPFPLMKLPLEIRYRILKLLIAPFYQYDSYHKKSFIELELKCFEKCDPKDPCYMRSFKKYVKSKGILLRDAPHSMEDNLNDMKEKQLKLKKHPLRAFKYDLRPSKPVDDFERQRNEKSLGWEAFKLLRDISNVSCTLRVCSWMSLVSGMASWSWALAVRLLRDEQSSALQHQRHLSSLEIFFETAC